MSYYSDVAFKLTVDTEEHLKEILPVAQKIAALFKDYKVFEKWYKDLEDEQINKTGSNYISDEVLFEKINQLDIETSNVDPDTKDGIDYLDNEMSVNFNQLTITYFEKCVKWYDCFPEVRVIESFFKFYGEQYAAQVIRVGEYTDDLTETLYGDGNLIERWMYVVRGIDLNG